MCHNGSTRLLRNVTAAPSLPPQDEDFDELDDLEHSFMLPPSPVRRAETSDLAFAERMPSKTRITSRPDSGVRVAAVVAAAVPGGGYPGGGALSSPNNMHHQPLHFSRLNSSGYPAPPTVRGFEVG